MGELSGVLVCILQVCTVTVNKEQGWWAELCTPRALQSTHILIPGPCECNLVFTLHGGTVCVNAIKSMILTWGDYSLGLTSHHQYPEGGRGRQKEVGL